MSIKKVEQSKQNNYFKMRDIIIYAVLIIVIASLFLVNYFIKDKSDIEGVEFYQNDILEFKYDFIEDNFEFFENARDNIDIKRESANYIVTYSNGSERNIFKIDTTARKITVVDANCSISKDCKTMSISSLSDMIICVPHKLLVKPYGRSNKVQDPTIG